MTAKKKAAKKASRSGSYQSDERRLELGHERLYLRPPAGTNEALAQLAERLGVTKAEALSIAVRASLKAK